MTCLSESIKIDQSITLPDGRQLGWCQYGAPEGKPLLFFHGWPNSRIEAEFISEFAFECGVRLISVDRPGFGRSSFQPGRTLMNWTEDINFAATSLGLEKYSILGLSGGAPYALACAYRYPQRITGLTIVSGLAPLNEVVNSLPNKFLLKLLLAIANKSTWLIYPFVMTEARTVKLKPHSYKRRLSKLSGPDGELYTNPVFADIRTQVVLEASRAGIKGWVYEANLLTKSWGFNIDGITIPIHLWYGMQDTYIPFVMAEYLASSLTHCKTHFIEGEGHVSLLVNHGMDIIKSMFNLQ